MKKYTILLFLITILIVSIFMISFSYAEENGKTKDGKKIVKLYANFIKYSKDKDKLIAEGNVKIEQEDVTITSKKADFNMKDKIGLISGNVVLTKEDVTISGDTMDADFNNKIYKFTGDVVLVQKRKDKEGKEEEVKWFCKGLTINGDKKDLTAKGGVRIERKDLKIEADEAQYIDETQEIILTGNVYIDQNNGEKWVKGDSGIVYLEEEDFEVKGHVESGFKLGE